MLAHIALSVAVQLLAAELPADAARLDELWKTRDEKASIDEANKIVDATLKATANDYETLWRAARIVWFYADGEKDRGKKKQKGKDALDIAERAVKANPEGQQGHYYVALGTGAYSQGMGIVEALMKGMEGQFVDNLEFSKKKDEAFDRYGVHSAKGRYWFELPWPKRDLAKGRTELELTIAKHPEHLRAYVYLAELELKDGNPKKAKELVEKVEQGSIDYDPPEGRRMKEWIKPIRLKVDEELK